MRIIMEVWNSVLSLFTTGNIENCFVAIRNDLMSLIAKHPKQGRADLRGLFTMDLITSRKDGKKKCPGIYIETRYAIVLYSHFTSGKTPVAFISFDRDFERYIVYQLEAIYSQELFLALIHWERVLLQAVVILGERVGMKEVHIVTADRVFNNPITNDDLEVTEENLVYCRQIADELKRRHEHVPGECGFRRSESGYTYFTRLGSCRIT